MRLITGGIMHETHTFSAEPTTLETLGVARGEELHAFAGRLGLRRAWFQTRAGRPWKDHYDLPEEVRPRAVSLGAVPLTFNQAGELLARKRRAERR